MFVKVINLGTLKPNGTTDEMLAVDPKERAPTQPPFKVSDETTHPLYKAELYKIVF